MPMLIDTWTRLLPFGFLKNKLRKAVKDHEDSDTLVGTSRSSSPVLGRRSQQHDELRRAQTFPRPKRPSLIVSSSHALTGNGHRASYITTTSPMNTPNSHNTHETHSHRLSHSQSPDKQYMLQSQLSNSPKSHSSQLYRSPSNTPELTPSSSNYVAYNEEEVVAFVPGFVLRREPEESMFDNQATIDISLRLSNTNTNQSTYSQDWNFSDELDNVDHSQKKVRFR